LLPRSLMASHHNRPGPEPVEGPGAPFDSPVASALSPRSLMAGQSRHILRVEPRGLTDR